MQESGSLSITLWIATKVFGMSSYGFQCVMGSDSLRSSPTTKSNHTERKHHWTATLCPQGTLSLYSPWLLHRGAKA